MNEEVIDALYYIRQEITYVISSLQTRDTKRHISDMKAGEIGYVVPWMIETYRGLLYISNSATVDSEPCGIKMPIKRFGIGIEIDELDYDRLVLTETSRLPYTINEYDMSRYTRVILV